MRCSKCGFSLPDDSEFCQYCGSKLHVLSDMSRTATSHSEYSPENKSQLEQKPYSPVSFQPPIQSRSQPKSKTQKFCKRCGAVIDNTTKKCSSCGKQYFRIRVLTSALLVLLVLSLAGLNVFQYMLNQDNLNKIKQLETTLAEKDITITTKENQISTKTNRINNLVKEVDDLEQENRSYARNLSFYEEYAGIVPDDGRNLYHIYRCNDLDTSSFWIYNIGAAEDRGYYPCPKCH